MVKPNSKKQMIATIGLCTYQRPQMLAETIKSLSTLVIPDYISLILIVIDNDSNQSAKPIFTVEKKQLPFDSYYAVEIKKGIVYARNKALDCADGYNTDLMFFIDDDEIVNPNWLIAHLAYHAKFDVDVVTGSLYSIYPETTPKWIRRGGFFDAQQNIKEGTMLKNAATNNVSFDYDKLCRQYRLHFDETLKSREDNDFFMRARMKGAIIKWTNTAIVYEIVPLSKMTVSWLLRRTYKTGEAYSKREIKCLGKIKGISMIAVKVLYRIINGIFLFPLSIIYGYAYIVKSLQQFSIVLGMIFGVIGVNYDDYRIIHGK